MYIHLVYHHDCFELRYIWPTYCISYQCIIYFAIAPVVNHQSEQHEPMRRVCWYKNMMWQPRLLVLRIVQKQS